PRMMRAAISLAGALWTMLASFRGSKGELSQSRAAGKARSPTGWSSPAQTLMLGGQTAQG
ncbi:hypothetical protein, partial [Escherichia coli]|uniref:hypothetical protein n=1 Tax=Escherichia coli TaxID=562 RepID=UPI0019536F04